MWQKPVLVILAVLAGLLSFCGAAIPQSTPPGTGRVPSGQAAGLSAVTVAALRTAASANLFEIESSHLALGRGQSEAIKEFAGRMVGDHARAATRVRQVLGEIGATLPTVMLQAEHQQLLDSLKAAANPQFDRSYVDAQYMVHVETIALVRDYARTGDNERLKALATEVLPLLQSHLDHVTGLR